MSIWHKAGIYVIENSVTGMAYVGSTTRTFRERKNEHWSALSSGDHGNPILQASWNKHRGSTFSFMIIEVVDKLEQIIDREQYWLDEYKKRGRCYNIGPAESSRFGIPHRQETKKKLSEATKRVMKSSSARKRISDSMKKLWKTEDYRRKVTESHVGTKATEESRRKRSEMDKIRARTDPAYQERLRRMNQKTVEVHSKTYDGFISPGGIIYREVKNLSAFCREHGLSQGDMRQVFLGLRKQHKGWTRYNPGDNKGVL